MAYLKEKEIIKALRNTDIFTDFYYEEKEPKARDMMYALGAISGRLTLLCELMEEDKNE